MGLLCGSDSLLTRVSGREEAPWHYGKVPHDILNNLMRYTGEGFLGFKTVSQVTSSDLLQVRLRKLLGAGGTVLLSFNVDDLDVEPD